MVAPLIVAAGVQILGTVIGQLLGKGKEEEAAALREKEIQERAATMARIRGIPLPQARSLVAEQIDASVAAQAKGDPQAYAATKAALSRLQQISSSQGLDAESRASLNESLNEAEGMATSNQKNIRENMLQRGVGGSGAEFAMQLGANQQAASRAGKAGFDAAAMAQRNAHQAIRDQATLGLQADAQQFGQSFQKGSAQDTINQWNTANRQRTNERNLANEYDRFNANLARETGGYPAAKDYAGGIGANAQRASNEAAATGAMWGSIGNSIGGGVKDWLEGRAKKKKAPAAEDDNAYEKDY